MNADTRSRILLLTCSVALGLVSGEILLRRMGHTTADGNFYLGTRRLRPYHLPVRSTQKAIDAYLASSTSFVMYDGLLGWAPRPGGSSANGLYRYNRDGVRTASTGHLIPRVPPRGTTRIAIFGDSFTHGDDVPFEITWGYLLEQNLKKAGVQAEVLNFGGGGYGTDQAFLRWRAAGRAFSPDLVILGFQAENVKRNVNLIRALYYPETGIPFAKPRYILDGGTLRLINSPTPSPATLVKILERISSWELIRYEYWINPADYNDRVWLRSRLASFILYAFDTLRGRDSRGEKERDVYRPGGEPARVTLAIVEEFKREVESSGGGFAIVHLPHRENLKILMRGAQLPYAALLEKIEAIAPVIRPDARLVREAHADSPRKLYLPHYSAAGNEIVADAVSESLLAARAAEGTMRAAPLMPSAGRDAMTGGR